MPEPEDTPLLLDVMLGKLATYLRMCSYDAAYALDRELESDDEILACGQREGRTLVTRDVALADAAPDAVLLRSLDVEDQLRELGATGFTLELGEPSRCSRCNGPLERVEADGRTPAFAPDPDEKAVWRCRECGQPYWRGSHWDDVERRLQVVRRDTV